MLFTNLKVLSDKDDIEILNRRKRIFEIALLDPSIKFALKVTSSKKAGSKIIEELHNDIWAVEVELVSSRGVKVKENVGFKKRINFNQVVNPIDKKHIKITNDDELFLTLDEEAIKYLFLYGEDNSFLFKTMIVNYGKMYPKEFFPDKEVSDDRYDIQLVLADENENSEIEFINIIYKIDDVYIFVDYEKSNNKDELKKLLPSLFHFPDALQEKLKKIPRKFSNRSERINNTLEIYIKYFENIPLNKKNILTEKWNYEIYNHKDYIKTNKINSEYELIDLQGKKLGKFSSKIIFPDFLIKDIHKQPKHISFSTPVKLWIVLCVAEFFWKNIDENNEKTHPVGKHIEKFFYRINNNDAKQSDKIEKDYIEFLKKYPEVRYFSDVKFRSDSVLAASLTRPSWADSKFKNFRRN